MLCMAVQQRPVANFLPDAVVLTSKRFMIYRTKMLGRYDFEDNVWRELKDVRIKEGVLGATISVETAGGSKLSVDYLPKQRAREVYRRAQALEEQALEERRQRSLEAERARSGAFVVPQHAITPAPAAPPAQDPVAKLTQLKSMLDAGLITEEEFASKKAEVLASM